jgi:hypothetical protein
MAPPVFLSVIVAGLVLAPQSIRQKWFLGHNRPKESGGGTNPVHRVLN